MSLKSSVSVISRGQKDSQEGYTSCALWIYFFNLFNTVFTHKVQFAFQKTRCFVINCTLNQSCLILVTIQCVKKACLETYPDFHIVYQISSIWCSGLDWMLTFLFAWSFLSIAMCWMNENTLWLVNLHAFLSICTVSPPSHRPAETALILCASSATRRSAKRAEREFFWQRTTTKNHDCLIKCLT